MSSSDVKYPSIRHKLLALAEEDQQDRRSFMPSKDGSPQAISLPVEEWIKRDRARADELLASLKRIRTPSVRNVGIDGSRAAWLIAQHNPEYQNLGFVMLRKMKYLYYKDKRQVYYRGIPYLVDRLMLIRQRWDKKARQLYGTQAYADSEGRWHSYPIIDREHLLDRLAKFDLDLRACMGLNESGS